MKHTHIRLSFSVLILILSLLLNSQNIQSNNQGMHLNQIPNDQFTSSPQLISRYTDSLDDADEGFIENDRLYVIDALSRVVIIDISDPYSPEKLGVLTPAPVITGGIYVINHILFLGTSDGLEIWDCTNPEMITYVYFYGNITNVLHLEILNDNAYIANETHLHIVSVWDLYLPTFLNEIEINIWNFKIKDPFAYIVGTMPDNNPSLNLLNISDYTNSTGNLKFVYSSEYADLGDLHITADYLVLIEPSLGFFAYSPGYPLTNGYTAEIDYSLWMNIRHVYIEGDYAYFSHSDGSIQIFDLSVQGVTPISTYSGDGGSGNDLLVKDGIIYLIDGAHGVEIILFDSSIKPDPDPDPDPDEKILSIWANSTTIYEGEWIEFNYNYSKSDPVWWQTWNFGDNTVNDSEIVVYHQFHAPGIHDVRLTVQTEEGIFIDNMYITVLSGTRRNSSSDLPNPLELLSIPGYSPLFLYLVLGLSLSILVLTSKKSKFLSQIG